MYNLMLVCAFVGLITVSVCVCVCVCVCGVTQHSCASEGVSNGEEWNQNYVTTGPITGPPQPCFSIQDY